MSPVVLRGRPTEGLLALTERAAAAASRAGANGRLPDLDAALELAEDLGSRLPPPGRGETPALWEALATLGAVDLTLARVVEPHLDALAILQEAEREGQPVPQDWPHGAIWGVYAAEGGGRLQATRDAGSGEWELTGPKPWCSLADRVSHALVTAWVDEERRGLFAIDLADPGVRLPEERTPWVSRGLAQVRSTALELDRVAAQAVGRPGWYLERPGFAWGGIGVAAIWFGGAVGVARRVRDAALSREPDQVALVHLGATDTALARARAVLVDAADAVDCGLAADASGLLALRVRQVVADTVEEVLGLAGHALGPGPLATDEEHARRVADLGIYVRQHHALRDTAALGRAVLEPCVDGAWSWW